MDEAVLETLGAETAGASDYGRIAAAIRYIDANRLDQPGLDDVARAVGLSPFHFQRLFTRWAGVSPKRFLGYLTLRHARALLERDVDVLSAALDAGLSGPSRLHDLCVTFEAVTPGDIRRAGEGMTVRYGRIETPFGQALALATPRGLCGLEFMDGASEDALLARHRNRWPEATFARDSALAVNLGPDSLAQGIPLHVRGTNFQLQVWQALLWLPPGHVTSYRHLACAIGKPAASRAVGNALSNNPLALLIPCHRVILSTGALDNYRWGAVRKQAMLGWEQAQSRGKG